MRNPDYFRAGRPYFDGIRHYIIGDPNTIIAALKTEQVLMSDSLGSNITPALALDLEKQMGGKLKAHWAGPPSALGVMMNARAGPFHDPRVRRAMMLVLHRQPIIQIVGGPQRIGTPIPSGFAWSFTVEDALKMPGFREPKDADIADAKRLLAEAGYLSGLKAVMTTRALVELPLATEVGAEQLKKALGWEVSVRQLDSAAASAAYATGDYQLAVEFNSFTFPDPDASAASYRKDSLAHQRTGYFNPDAEALWDGIARELDPAKRREMVLKANAVLLADNAFPYLYYRISPWPVNARIKNFHAPPNFTTHKKHEHLWWDPDAPLP